ncbi:MAG: hypothetical protein Q9164_006612, partial [Protoblastenia rupestris]
MAPCEVTEDYNANLEVTQSATVDSVRQNYRRLAKVLHPDKNPNNPSATASFQRRLSSKRIKENDLARQETSVQSLKGKLQDVNGKIAAVKKKGTEAARAREANRQEHVKKEQEAKERAEEQEERERLAKMRAEWAKRRTKETAARAAKQAREAQEAKEAEERIRRDQAARENQCAREAQQARHREHRARVARAAAQAARNNMSKPATTARSSAPKKTLCQHDAFWPK